MTHASHRMQTLATLAATLTLISLALISLAGCGSQAASTPSENPTIVVSGSSTPVANGSGPDQLVLAQRAAAGIADCPETDLDAKAEVNGLPRLTLACIGGDTSVNLAGLAIGSPVIINVWAQWCGPCRAEAPVLKYLSARVAGKVRMIGIDVADPDAGAAIDFAKASGWTYPQLADPDKTVGIPLKLVGLPETVFVDKSGVIVHRQVGAMSTDAEATTLVKTYFGISA